MEQKLQEMHTKEDDSIFRNPQSPLPKGAPPHPVVPHPQGRDKLKIAGTDDLQSFGIARKACALKGERYFCSHKLAAIALVAAGYAGDMDEDLANELLDDIDYHFNKVKCRKIEGLMPRLMEMVEREMSIMR
jgi:hypothetical protein